eukprot:CAMPEP_0168757740 /NCGR_PEP_ID=MMETSP0724-20121128/21331_1 /TAXON_ID=265536 /ORGANISM="Amphiprora sp., Strain CCMP467" /LENGTH=708 /DNA_ID=CAMNT_0008806577 /DNA_START=112 /DNA_END=2238 /DNA_ORIENTATION=-
MSSQILSRHNVFQQQRQRQRRDDELSTRTTATVPLPRRTEVRERIASVWQQQRQGKPSRRHPSSCATAAHKWTTTTTTTTTTTRWSLGGNYHPPLLSNNNNNNDNSSNNNKNHHRHQKGKTTSTALSTRGFPSLLAIHQAHELAKQVDLIRPLPLDDEDDDDCDEHDYYDTPDEPSISPQVPSSTGSCNEPRIHQKASSTPQKQHRLDILPAGYDLEQAVRHLAQSRSRAFWLLDLATVVYRCVAWNRLWNGSNTSGTTINGGGGGGGGAGNNRNSNRTAGRISQPQVRFLFGTSFNSDPILLRLLSQQPNVRLVTSTAWDYERCRQALSSSTTATAWSTLVGDASHPTGKPDGYLRQVLLGPEQQQEDDDAGENDKKNGNDNNPVVSCIAVDGPQEIHRIWDTLERVRRRRRRRRCGNGRIPEPNVCLCFDNNWKTRNDGVSQLWQDTEAALRERRSQASQIVAVSMDVSGVMDNRTDKPQKNRLAELCEFLSQQQQRQDDSNTSASTAPRLLRLELTGCVRLEDEESMAFLTQLRRNPKVASIFGEICVDMTESLLTSAGALCTRVIGVRQSANHTEDDDDGIRQHYYIDDGCYGSLYQQQQEQEEGCSSQHRCPVPLKLQPQPTATLTDDGDAERQPPTRFLSTIWGPTCDGLDRVFADIQLPLLHRDDWLVFPNQCNCGGGLGTAFNGFTAPDTAYCVLGYFGK